MTRTLLLAAALWGSQMPGEAIGGVIGHDTPSPPVSGAVHPVPAPTPAIPGAGSGAVLATFRGRWQVRTRLGPGVRTIDWVTWGPFLPVAALAETGGEAIAGRAITINPGTLGVAYELAAPLRGSRWLLLFPGFLECRAILVQRATARTLRGEAIYLTPDCTELTDWQTYPVRGTRVSR